MINWSLKIFMLGPSAKVIETKLKTIKIQPIALKKKIADNKARINGADKKEYKCLQD